MPEETFRWWVDQANGEGVVVLRRDLDLGVEPEALRAIGAAEATGLQRMIIDLSGLTSMGSSGVRLLSEAAECARASKAGSWRSPRGQRASRCWRSPRRPPRHVPSAA